MPDIAERVASAVDRNLIVDLLTRLVDTPSPTGHEADIARLLAGVFREYGLETRLQNLYEERYNVVGRWQGTGGGPTLLFSGHLDTSVRGDEDYLHGSGWKNHAQIVDGAWLYGNGAFNMKNGFASFVAALVALRSCGVRLPGDVILAGTAGEIEMAPIDEFEGRDYDGYGTGMWHLLGHGVAADVHVLPEPTGLRVHVGMFGTVWTKITTHGAFAHTAWSATQPSAIKRMRPVIGALEEWSADYKRRNAFMGVEPEVNIAAIRGGLPWRAARTPNLCRLYVDVRIPPQTFPLDVQLELRDLVSGIAARERMPIDIEFYMSRPGTLLAPTHPVVRTVADAHRASTGATADVSFAPPFCTDAIDSNRFGIPTVVYGAGGRARAAADSKGHAEMTTDARAIDGEYVFIDDVVTAARVFAATALEICSQDRSEFIRDRKPMPAVDLEVATT